MKKESFSSKVSNFFNMLFNNDKNINMSKVDVWAMCYEKIFVDDLGKSIQGAKITDAHSGEVWETNEKGYAHIDAKPGRKLTLIFEREGYAKVQTATVTVPKCGLTGEFNELSFQTPSIKLYNLLKAGLGNPKQGCSHIVTTIQPDGHNMHKDKGMAGVQVFLCDKQGNEIPASVYLGQFMKQYSEWVQPVTSLKLSSAGEALENSDNKILKAFAKTLKNAGKNLMHKSTSHDGAAIFLNVPKGEYVMKAKKKGFNFTTANVEVLDTSPEFINVSPPQAPREIPLQEIDFQIVNTPKRRILRA